jgi:hypothetical protein
MGDSIIFCSTAIANGTCMLEYHDIAIAGGERSIGRDLNPTFNYPSSLPDLSNTYILTDLLRKNSNSIGHGGWANLPLSYD